ncbi:MAG TPA: 16S rRNA (cytidine(1402)-2'-O)-methyltransferase [Nitrospiria bacterium]|nr:16S rRNA (cytidine(1402)-2'-O)-methyltransferase [Nitrospiria bacterium]
MDNTEHGVLYIVSTPIGHLEDITLRALRVLKEVRLIAAEDTRHTQKMLNHYQIHTPLTSYHDHNKEEKAEVLVQRLKEGHAIALVTDAGTPGISDPGYYLINRCIQAGLPLSPVPGPSAFLAALAVSGLPTDAFLFEGFLPKKRIGRLKHLQALKDEPRTVIFYESPHRLVRSLHDVHETWGDRRAVVARELTKIFEEIIRGKLSQIIATMEGGAIRGEITLVIEGCRTISSMW